MKFKNILQEIFADKSVKDKDYYKVHAEVKKNAPKRFTPIIYDNGINDQDDQGAVKSMKKKPG